MNGNSIGLFAIAVIWLAFGVVEYIIACDHGRVFQYKPALGAAYYWFAISIFAFISSLIFALE